MIVCLLEDSWWQHQPDHRRRFDGEIFHDLGEFFDRFTLAEGDPMFVSGMQRSDRLEGWIHERKASRDGDVATEGALLDALEKEGEASETKAFVVAIHDPDHGKVDETVELSGLWSHLVVFVDQDDG